MAAISARPAREPPHQGSDELDHRTRPGDESTSNPLAGLQALDRLPVAQQLLPIRLQHLGPVLELVVQHPPDALPVFIQRHQPVQPQRFARVADRDLAALPVQPGVVEETRTGRAVPDALGDAQHFGGRRAEFEAGGVGQGLERRGTGVLRLAHPLQHPVHRRTEPGGLAGKGRFIASQALDKNSRVGFNTLNTFAVKFLNIQDFAEPYKSTWFYGLLYHL